MGVVETNAKHLTRYWAVVTPISAVELNADPTSYLSAEIITDRYSKGLLLLNVDVTASPTDVVISIYFSDDGTTYYKYMSGPFVDLRYEDAAGDKLESIDLPILAPYMKIGAVATGTDGDNTFTITAKVILST